MPHVTKTDVMRRRTSWLPCRLAFLVLYRVPHLPVSPAIHHKIPTGKKMQTIIVFRYLCLLLWMPSNQSCKTESILPGQPSPWSCPTVPLSIVRIVYRSSQCRALCGTVSQCLSTPQTLYWLTRGAPMRKDVGVNGGNSLFMIIVRAQLCALEISTGNQQGTLFS